MLKTKCLLKKVFVAGALCLTTGLTSQVASACDKIPESQTQSINQLITRTNNIVIAQAKKPEIGGDGLYTVEFEVSDVLKGSQWSNFILQGKPTTPDKLGNDFNKHGDLQFWAYLNTGNFFRDKDCNLYGYFERGRQYLIFIDKPFHPKSFELISSQEDSWLKEVKKQLEKAG